MPDAGASLRAVLCDGSSRVRLQPVQFVVQLREQGGGNLRCKVVGKHLFGPHVVKPLHCHRIAKPHVAGFVCNELCASQFLVGGRFRGEEQGVVVVEGGSGMLHPAKLESGQHHEVVLAEGVSDPCELLLPVQGEGYLPGNLRQLCHAGRVSLPVEGSQPLFREVGVLKLAGGKGKEVGGQRFAGLETPQAVALRLFGLPPLAGGCILFSLRLLRRVAHRLPVVGNQQLQGEACFQVRLVETGECGACPVGYKECIDVAVPPVERLFPCREVQLYPVLPPLQGRGGQHDVVVGDAVVAAFAVGLDAVYLVGRFAEVQHHLPCLLQREADAFRCLYRLVSCFGDAEVELVGQCLDGLLALLRQLQRHAFVPSVVVLCPQQRQGSPCQGQYQQDSGRPCLQKVCSVFFHTYAFFDWRFSCLQM